MFYVFSVPQSFDGIKVIFGWGGQVVPRILSLINVFIYLKIVRREYAKRLVYKIWNSLFGADNISLFWAVLADVVVG